MCLSTVYENMIADDTVIMKNVANVSVEDGYVILTDLMERKTKIKGLLVKADLIDNYILIKTQN